MNMSEKEEIIILGASLFAEEVADYISKIEKYTLVGFIEGINRDRCRKPLSGLPVIWIDDVAKSIDARSCKAVCAVGSTKRKHFIQQAATSGLEFTTIVHPAAQVSDTASIGIGTIISPGAIIAVSTRIGCHVIINRGCLIGHHVEIGDYVTISPGANIAGRTKIGNLSYIGMGAVILDGISIGSNSVVGAGSVVTKDVPDSVQVLGMPARISKELKD
jgi:sugar O-acyltransferase (sialic acid O-acetyltransferase NeuD family)